MNTSCRTMRKELSLFMRVIRQERTDTNKIYSLHEPEVECISKGKDYKKINRLTGYVPAEAVTDRGYRGRKWVGAAEISIPSSGKPGQSYYQKRKARKKFGKRAGIEPVIDHLKSDHRMIRNFLKGTRSDAINTLMAAAAYNMRHWMNKRAASLFVSWLKTLARCLENTIFENENQYVCKCSCLAVVAGQGFGRLDDVISN